MSARKNFKSNLNSKFSPQMIFRFFRTWPIFERNWLVLFQTSYFCKNEGISIEIAIFHGLLSFDQLWLFIWIFQNDPFRFNSRLVWKSLKPTAIIRNEHELEHFRFLSFPFGKMRLLRKNHRKIFYSKTAKILGIEINFAFVHTVFSR